MSHALVVEGISKSFGGIRALQGVSFTLKSGGVHALIGPNGAGKTTLVSVIAGEIAPDTGSIVIDKHDITRVSAHERARMGLARTYQITSLFSGLTVRRNVELALISREAPKLRPANLLRRYQPARYKAETDEVLNDFGLTRHAEATPNVLSHGDRRRLELAVAIASKPDVLLLDEPLAGLSHADAEVLVALIAGRLKGEVPILLIEHDMDAVFDLADDITVLVNGTVLEAGPPAVVRASKAVQKAYLSEEDDF